MAACDPVTFQNVNINTFNCLRGKLEGIGYNLEGTSGTISGPMGIVIAYRWDEPSASLYIEVKEKNFFVPCGRIRSELEKAIESCR